MALLVCTCGAGSLTAQNHPINSNSFMEEKLTLTQEWDKVFPKSDKVNHTKVTRRGKRTSIGTLCTDIG